MSLTIAPVLKSVVVQVNAEHAFKVFTEGFDTWWPRSHHIGSSPMTRAVIEGFVGGRCYSEQVDGADCPWGEVTVWEPPRRLVFAWLITPEWKYQPDRSRASEVEVSFTPLPDGTTRVDLEHRHFERYGDGGEAMRNGVGGDGGWGSLLQIFKTTAEQAMGGAR
jgi:uncharacterized protein YndB with AHSA1/START domain